jgi:hypothetical protein
MVSRRCSRGSGSSIGWLVSQTFWRIYSEGGRFRCGVSSRNRLHTRSSRQANAGSQANPASTTTTRNSGNASNSPSITMLASWDWQHCAWPVISSM